jgi:hypothetical protein
MNPSMTNPAPAAHLLSELSEVSGKDRILGRSQASLTDAMTFLAWYAPGIFTAVMDYMDTVDGEPVPARM